MGILSKEEKEWAYTMWCIGYTQQQIADALFVCCKTVQRTLKGKPRIRPILIYERSNYEMLSTRIS